MKMIPNLKGEREGENCKGIKRRSFDNRANLC
jgi:hypothetical protein